MTSRARRLGSGVVAALLAVPWGCGDDPVVPEVIEEVDFAPELSVDLTQMTKRPSGLYVQDIVEGDGAAPGPGERVDVDHVGWLRTGVVFTVGEIAFTLGAGEVVSGLDEGVSDMKVGGRRRLVVPPDLGYGDEGSDRVPPGAILVIVVDLLAIG